MGWFRAMRTRVALAGVLCAALLPVTTAQAEPTGSQPYTVWQWNVAGSTLNDGKADTGMVEGAVASIVSRGADFAAFNELCKSQWNALVTQLRAAGWPEAPTNFGRFEPSLAAGEGACGGDEFGNAIFSKRALGEADRIALPADGKTEKRNMLCATLVESETTRFCTTHLTVASNAAKWGQLEYVRRKLDTWTKAGETVLIAGDFNVQPHYDSLDTFYAPSVATDVNSGNQGFLRELDDTDTSCLGYGEWTGDDAGATLPNKECPLLTRPKIDMIFVPESVIDTSTPYSADSLTISTSCDVTAKSPSGRCSDHRVLVGTVTVKQ
ncbi:endonuclease/exonuclease/phosphatase family protein [Streptomyces sp. NPDC012693]|jgi:endonuclease/exonuclease/phosphatase family metal-dependent hydrolase|uniref:endonuclease/exonuclease/phosphatase family protein n=1 Tax=unclassified Streptomyces TaxID=2593676 RepID=UPI00202EEAF5|nr:endonuclease/exonuclease/phosphatase family protein [Streptomyces sp. MSC1_001]